MEENKKVKKVKKVKWGGAIARLANYSVTDRRVTHPPRGELKRAVRARRTGGWREARLI